MKTSRAFGANPPESGVALLIAIFALLLISLVAISLIVSAGMESSLDANYRSSTSVYYAAYAGLEEGRGRLYPQNPNYFGGAVLTLPLAVGQVRYITNPVPGETVAPWNLNSSAGYPDTEYATEFGVPISSATWTQINSTSTVAGIQGPLYKWVRINPITERSINIDVNNDGLLDQTTALYFDGANLNLTSTGAQALEITSLAVLPGGSQKMLQYVVAKTSGPPFPSAFTIAGNGQTQCQIQGQGSTMISGVDHAPGAAPGSGVAGMALSSTTDFNQCRAGINAQSSSLVVGAAPYNTTPSMRNTSVTSPPLDPSLDPSQGLSAFTNSLIQQANQTFNGNIPSGANLGTASNPMITYVNNPTQLGAITGYGILLVMSNQAQLQIDGNISWNGVIMLVATSGQAQFQMQSGTGSINGAFFMGATNGAQVQMQMQQGPSGGINYDSRWINNAFQSPYRILAFKELKQ